MLPEPLGMSKVVQVISGYNVIAQANIVLNGAVVHSD